VAERLAGTGGGMSSETIIASWPRNGRETIIVKLGEYQGKPICDVRTWYRADDGLRPSRSGITLSTKHLGQLAEALARAAEIAATDPDAVAIRLRSEARAMLEHADALEREGKEGPGPDNP